MNLINEFPHGLVLVIYLSQLMIISIVVSHSWRKSRLLLLQKYPEATFPNLYVQPANTEFNRLTIRKWLDHLAFIIGGAAFVIGLLLNITNTQWGNLLIIVAIIQMLPVMLSAYWCTRNSFLMGTKHPTKLRKTAFKNHTTSAVLPIIKAVVAISLYLASLTIGLSIDNNITSSSELAKLNQLHILNTALFVTIILLCLRLIFGTKHDNFAEPAEAKEKLDTKLNYLLNGIIAFNTFIIAILLSKYFNLDGLYITLTASIFVQLIIYTTKEQYLPINPNVYKADI